MPPAAEATVKDLPVWVPEVLKALE
jgi:hypothetical protein